MTTIRDFIENNEEVTKCIEVRFCDSYEEIFEAAKIKRENYYIDEYESEDAYVL